jgi:hypothetical protein
MARFPVDTKYVLKLLVVDDSVDHACRALRVVKSCRKDCPMAKVLLEAKAVALHPDRYQSSLSKLSIKGRVRRGREAQAIGLASQSTSGRNFGPRSNFYEMHAL